MGNVRRRVGALERQTGADKPRQRTVIRDEHGHELWPMGRPRQGDVTREIFIGGIDIKEDI